MKTQDLSLVPAYGRANAVFIGATRYSGPRALLAHWPKWIRLRRRLKNAPGFKYDKNTMTWTSEK